MPPKVSVEILEWLRVNPEIKGLFTEKNGYRHPATNEHITDLYYRLVVSPAISKIVQGPIEPFIDVVPHPEDIELYFKGIGCEEEFGIDGRMVWDKDEVPKVSIITATRNRPDYLLNAYRSCFDQTFHNWEWIVLDGSDIPTAPDALKKLCPDRRISIFRTKGHKISPLWNFGLKQARGKYVCILDDDNWNHPDFLKYTVDAMDKDDSLVGVATWFEMRDDNGKVNAWCDTIRGTGPINFESVRASNCGDGNNILWRKSDLDVLGGFDDSLWTNEDFDLIRREIKVGRVGNIPKTLHYYRTHSLNRCHLSEGLGHDRDYKWICGQTYEDVIDKYIEKVNLSNISVEGLVKRIMYISEWRPLQWKEEMVDFLNFLNTLKPKKVLEIGIANGGTSLLLANGIKNEHKTYGIDIWIRDKVKDILVKKGINVTIGDSKLMCRYLEMEGPFDVIFVDGDHTLNGVAADFQNYFNLLSADGIMAFHDINTNTIDDPGCHVHEFWEEIKHRFRTKEINYAPPNKGYGIGIIFKEGKEI